MRTLLFIIGTLVGVVLLVAIIGAMLPRRHVASRAAHFQQSPDAIWDAITNHAAFPSWRTDLKRVESLPDRQGRTIWQEVGRTGEIAIEVVESERPRRLVTRIADPKLPFGGSWTYALAASNGGGTILRITEDGEVYNPIFRFVSRFVVGHHGTMETYLRQLGRKYGQDIRIDE